MSSGQLSEICWHRYRFNGEDGRLDRSLEAATMFMEALVGFEHKLSCAAHAYMPAKACIQAHCPLCTLCAWRRVSDDLISG
jgi:hypothetical protein